MTDGDGTVHYSEIVPFSAEGYAALALQQGKPNLQNAMQQMVLYGEAAKAYLSR